MTNAELGLSCDHLNGERGVTQKIKQAMHDAARQFVYIGFLLWEVREYEYFYENNYANVYEYAEAELGFKRSSTKNFIAICENFCKKSEHYSNLPTMHLDERWSDYQYSQLTEMLAMSSKQREQTQHTMTVKQLRGMKKAPKVEQVTIDELEPITTGQTSGQVNDEYGKGTKGKHIQDPDPNKWYDASWQVPAAWDRKLKLVIQNYCGNNRQFQIGYYKHQEEQWCDIHGNNIRVEYWMVLPEMPARNPGN